MADACTPVAVPRVVIRSQESSSRIFRKLTKELIKKARVQDRPDYWAQGNERFRNFLKAVGLAVEGDPDRAPEVVIQQLRAKGLAMDSPDGLAVKTGADLDDVAPALAALKQVYQSMGNGMQDLAEGFLRKQAMGESGAFDSGLGMLRQVRAMSEIGLYIADADRKMGQGLLLQKLQDPEFAGWASRRFNVPEESLRKRAGDVAKGIDVRIVELINAGKKAEAEKILSGLAEAVATRGSVEEIVRTTSLVNDVGDMIWTVAINGMLSSPRTATVNLASSINAVARPMLHLAGAWMGTVFGSGQMKRLAKIEVAAAMEHLTGQREALGDAFRLFMLAMNRDRGIYGGNIDVNNAVRSFQGGWSGANVSQMLQDTPLAFERNSGAWDAIDLLGKIITTPGRILQATDDLTKHLAIRGQVRAQGVRRFIGESQDVDLLLRDRAGIEKKIQKEMEAAFDWSNPNLADRFQLKMTYDQYLRVRQEAVESTFQEDNSLASGVSQFLSTPAGRLFRPFMPFVRTPLNILKQGVMENSPLGGVAEVLKLADLPGTNEIYRGLDFHGRLLRNASDDPQRFFRQAGAISFSTLATGAIYSLVQSGQVVGGGPRAWSAERNKWDADRFWVESKKEQGFREGRYEIKLPGGTTMDWSQFGEPFTVWLKLVANIAEYSGYMDEREKDASMFVAAMMGARGLADASFLKGLQSVMQLLFDQDPGGQRAMRAASDYVGVFMPFGSLMGYVSSLTNKDREANWGWEMNNSDLNLFVDALTERWQSRTPGFGNNPRLMDPVFGEPVPIAPGVGPAGGLDAVALAIPFMPLPSRQGPRAPIYDDIYRLTGGYRPYRGGTFKLTLAEQMELNRRQGSILINGMTKAQAFRRFFQRPDVRAALDGGGGIRSDVRTALEDEFSRLDRKYGEAALAQMVAQSQELQARYHVQSRRESLEDLADNEQAFAEIQKLDELLKQSLVSSMNRQTGGDELTVPGPIMALNP